jgi:hypothetical protein
MLVFVLLNLFCIRNRRCDSKTMPQANDALSLPNQQWRIVLLFKNGQAGVQKNNLAEKFQIIWHPFFSHWLTRFANRIAVDAFAILLPGVLAFLSLLPLLAFSRSKPAFVNAAQWLRKE